MRRMILHGVGARIILLTRCTSMILAPNLPGFGFISFLSRVFVMPGSFSSSWRKQSTPCRQIYRGQDFCDDLSRAGAP
ncbi:hypothetical protein GGR53DRAFT_46471 [Hypoxylon sp. FL1150]|nr:hypothetical protein GGR53DRAFT_46471 [Hypoxylon sp. FL1150]